MSKKLGVPTSKVLEYTSMISKVVVDGSFIAMTESERDRYLDPYLTDYGVYVENRQATALEYMAGEELNIHYLTRTTALVVARDQWKTVNKFLIDKLANDTVARYDRDRLMIIAGQLNKETSKKAFAKTIRNGANLIASDQSNKLGTTLNHILQKDAGIKRYKWSTSADERVRDRHVHLNGKIYEWGEYTGAEDGLAPGLPIRCRCIALPIIEG